MGRAPCCEKIGLRRGRWTAEEDKLLSDYIQAHGEGSWRSLPKNAGLLRCGKSCRLRWINYLRSDVKRGNISTEEEDLILKLHASLGNRWSLIAGHLAGRTDNEIKNYWNSHLSRKITPPTPTVPTKRRSSALKSRKPRKTSSTLRTTIDKQSSTNPSGDGSSVEEPVVPDSSSPSVGEIENVLDDFFDDDGQLNVDPINGVLNLTDQQNVVDNTNMDVENSTGQIVESGSAASSSTNESNEGKQEFGQDWEWDWDFEIGNNDMVGLGLGGEKEDDIIMSSWPWMENPTQVMGVDVEKQDAMIAWLLS